MKRYCLYLIVFFVFICNIVFAQPATPAAAANGALITLDFQDGTPKPDKHFPFDKYFTIHLTNIPTAVDKIEVRLQTDPAAIIDYKSKNTRTDDSPADVILGTWRRNDADPAHTTGDIAVTTYLKYNTDFLVKITSSSTKPIADDQKPALRLALAGNPDIGALIEKMGKVSAADPALILVDYKTEIIAVLKKALQKINPNYSFKEPEAIPVIELLRDFRQDIFNVSDPIGDFESQTKQHDAEKAMLRKAFNSLNWGSLQVNSAQYQAFKNVIGALKSAEPADNPNINAVKAILDNIGNAIDPAIAKRDELMQALIDRVALTDSYEASAVNTTYDPNFVTSAGAYITLDIGMPYVGRIDRVIMYSGVNIYFRPIDKSIPLEHYKKWDRIWSRTSLLLGVSLSSIEKEGERKGLIGQNALVLGLGYRILPFFKINTGMFCHYRYENNPVVDLSRYHFSTSPFIGLSIDADVKQLFSAFGTPFQ